MSVFTGPVQTAGAVSVICGEAADHAQSAGRGDAAGNGAVTDTLQTLGNASQKHTQEVPKTIKNALKTYGFEGVFGDPAGIRTPDPLLKRQLLCRLSYRIMSYSNARPRGRVWLGRLDSNQRVRESKSLALPLGDAPL